LQGAATIAGVRQVALMPRKMKSAKVKVITRIAKLSNAPALPAT